MKAIILAGGKGTRLRPYTTVIPKPLVPVGDEAILEILLGNLRLCGVREVVLCVNHLAELIKAFFGDGTKYGLKIDYSMEDIPLSTVAPLKLIENLPENFLVMNGDLLTDLNFQEFYANHVDSGALLSVAAHRRPIKIDFGVIDVNEDLGRATGFREKPTYTFDVSMGVYVFNRDVLRYVPSDQPFGFDDLMKTMLRNHECVNIYRYDGYWLDIGRPADYEQACSDMERFQCGSHSMPIEIEAERPAAVLYH